MLALLELSQEAIMAEKNPVVLMSTSMGNIRIELDAVNAPISSKNFVDYVSAGHYDGLIFHRVIPGFMIQGGGMDSGMKEKRGQAPIKNEAANGLKNNLGTIAMARTSVVDSATAQFFINVKNNDFLNHRGTAPAEFGYAVFGKVIEGMEVVHGIEKVPTGNRGGHQDVPVDAVVINSAKLEA
jgi:cyclophilin family peptidyl-prolyl cis-trans isomerase